MAPSSTKLVYALVAVLLMGDLVAGYTFEAFAATNYGGRDTIYTNKGGRFSPGYRIKSYKWDSSLGDRCCVKMCIGHSEVGHWCSDRKNPSTDFTSIIMGCGRTVLTC